MMSSFQSRQAADMVGPRSSLEPRLSRCLPNGRALAGPLVSDADGADGCSPRSLCFCPRMDYFTHRSSGILSYRSCTPSVRVECLCGNGETLMRELMPRLIFLAGAGQLCILIASTL